MNGYIALTSSDWCYNLKKNGNKQAIFWRKRLQFKAIAPGEYYFFYSKTSNCNARCIVGYAVYKETRIVRSLEAWKEFKTDLGSASEEDFLNAIQSFYKEADVNLGCICLDNIHFFETPVSLKDCGVEFSPYIVSGKRITREECNAIFNIQKGMME